MRSHSSILVILTYYGLFFYYTMCNEFHDCALKLRQQDAPPTAGATR